MSDKLNPNRVLNRQMKFKPALFSLLVCLTYQISTGVSHASSCKGVKFNFANSRGTKVKIEKVIVNSDKSTWAQDISNKVVFPGESYTTDKLRFSKLSSGDTGTFQVRFLRFDRKTERWGGARTLKGRTLRCDDNMTIRFELE